jgi:beta-mannosidase
MHLWGPRGFYKAPFYTENIARFVSEIGYHGCPNLESLKKMMSPDKVYPWVKGEKGEVVLNGGRRNPEGLVWNNEWICKSSVSHPNAVNNTDRNFLMTNQIREMFGDFSMELEDFVMASQIVQAEAKKYFIEFWRMNKGERNGILWWNLRDGWPLLSDAIVDYYGGKKLAYDYIKRVQTDVCVMIGDVRKGNYGHPVMLVNDTRTPLKVEIVIKDKDSGRTLLSKKVGIEANGLLKVGELPEAGKDELWLIEYRVDGKTYHNHYVAYTQPLEFEKYKNWLNDLNL